MPSGVQQQGKNRYDCVYEQPWGGVSSDADPSDIAPNELQFADGVFIKNGRINAAGWGNTTAFRFSNSPTSTVTYFNGGDIIDFVKVIYIQSLNQWVMFAFAGNTGRVYQYDPVAGYFTVERTLGFNASFDCIQVIAGTVYIFDFLFGRMYVYKPFVSFTTGQSFVGGKYCCVITHYLLTAYTNQPTDTPAIKTNRYNWSSPDGYTTFDPAVDRTAGFNNLTSVSDQITNIFAMGNVGYILRTQGLTQLTPNGIGIGPFDDTDLWDSEFGVGCTYPDTFDQYGNVAMWLNDNNLYAFTTGGIPQGVTGKAKAAIFADINKYENDLTVKTFISGSLSNVSELSTKPELTYTLVIVNVTGNSIKDTAIWTYNLNDKVWTRQTPDLDFQFRSITGVNSNYSIDKIVAQGTYETVIAGGAFQPNRPPKRIRNNIILNAHSGGIQYCILFSFYYSENGAASGCPAALPINLQFKQEEFRLTTLPTIRGLAIKLAGIGSLNINVLGEDANSVPVNVQYGPLILSAVNRFVVQKKLTNLCTQQNPQIIITSTNWDGSIIKLRMFITFDEGEPV